MEGGMSILKSLRVTLTIAPCWLAPPEPLTGGLFCMLVVSWNVAESVVVPCSFESDEQPETAATARSSRTSRGSRNIIHQKMLPSLLNLFADPLYDVIL
jgi:hypothetical protein